MQFEIGTIDFKHCDTKMINEKFAFKAKPQNFSVDFCLQRYCCCCWWWWSFLFKVQLVHEKCCHEKLIEKCFKKYFNYHLISTYLFSFAIIHSTNCKSTQFADQFTYLLLLTAHFKNQFQISWQKRFWLWFG